MPVSWERSVFVTGRSHRVDIPAPILRALNLKKGDKPSIWLDGSHIVMEPSKKKKKIMDRRYGEMKKRGKNWFRAHGGSRRKGSK
jgi:antitoxin component of MazEF toxin-antitoxin module